MLWAVILDMEALYGYVSGTPQKGARERSELQRDGREWRDRAEKEKAPGDMGKDARENRKERRTREGRGETAPVISEMKGHSMVWERGR